MNTENAKETYLELEVFKNETLLNIARFSKQHKKDAEDIYEIMVLLIRELCHLNLLYYESNGSDMCNSDPEYTFKFKPYTDYINKNDDKYIPIDMLKVKCSEINYHDHISTLKYPFSYGHSTRYYENKNEMTLKPGIYLRIKFKYNNFYASIEVPINWLDYNREMILYEIKNLNE